MELMQPDVLTADMLVLPGEDDLPCDDGVPMETQRHVLQLNLLMDPLLLHWADRHDCFVGGNMFLYFSVEQIRHNDFFSPDFFVALDVPRRERKSWVVWQEGKGPDVVIELLSESTAERDRGEKKRIYQDRLRVPEYFWFDPFSGEWAGFGLVNGIYEPREPDEAGRLISGKLNLALTRWEGEYKSVRARWLRWETLEGELLPTPQEVAEGERRRAEEERRRADDLAAELARYREQFGELPE